LQSTSTTGARFRLDFQYFIREFIKIIVNI
jgi:hypothetical protein